MTLWNKKTNDMKTLIRTIVILSALVGAAACQQFEIDTQMTPEKEYANLRLICDAVDAYQFASTGAESISFNVSANTPWTITRSSGADWCTVTPSSSASSSLISDVVVSVADNESGAERSATLTIKGERVNKTYTVKINQSRKGHLFVTPVAQDFAATGGPLSFTINTNVPWTVRSDVSWLKFNRESGEPDPDGRTITIIATAEPSSVTERVATVTVTAGDDEESFEVSQKAVFEMTEISGEFPGAGGSQALKIRTDLPWTVSADKGWISFDKEEGTGDGKLTVITVTAAANDDIARTAEITVNAGGENHTFEVRQGGAAFEIIAPADPTIDRLGGELLVEVNASKAWEPQTDVPGFTVEKVDSLKFNQVSGARGVVHFDKGSPLYADVFENVKTVYHITEEPEKGIQMLIGVNVGTGKDMRIYFNDKSPDRVVTYGAPDMYTYPLSKLPADQRLLPGFAWYSDRRPARWQDVFKW